MSELAHLTDRQLVEIYAHERDERGSVKMPQMEAEATVSAAADLPSLERELRDLVIVAAHLRMPREAFEKAVEKLKSKWAAKEKETADG